MGTWAEEVYDDTFDETLESNGLLFVDFYADWCGPCKAVAPVVERVAREYAGRVAFVKLNTDGNPRTAARFGIRSIPAMILFENGRPVATLSGYQPEHVLRSLIEGHAPPASAAPEQHPRRGLLSRLMGREA